MRRLAFLEEDALDERQMTPAMLRALEKIVSELKAKVGDKMAKELLKKYMGQDEKDQ